MTIRLHSLFSIMAFMRDTARRKAFVSAASRVVPPCGSRRRRQGLRAVLTGGLLAPLSFAGAPVGAWPAERPSVSAERCIDVCCVDRRYQASPIYRCVDRRYQASPIYRCVDVCSIMDTRRHRYIAVSICAVWQIPDIIRHRCVDVRCMADTRHHEASSRYRGR